MNYFGTVYIKQFFEVCTRLDAKGYVISTLPTQYVVREIGPFILENRPEPLGRAGLLYHLAVALWFIRLVPRLLSYRPDILIVTAFQNYWFLLFFLRWFGVNIVPSVHCTLWPKFAPVKRSWRILLQLNRLLIYRYAKAILVVSNDIMRQLRALAGDVDLYIVRVFPTYPPSQFASIARPSRIAGQPFRSLSRGAFRPTRAYDLA